MNKESDIATNDAHAARCAKTAASWSRWQAAEEADVVAAVCKNFPTPYEEDEEAARGLIEGMALVREAHHDYQEG
jgi:hypothetical protein